MQPTKQIYYLALLLLLAASLASGYVVGVKRELRRTRTSRWLSTKANVGVAVQTERAAVADDEAVDDRWFPWPNTDDSVAHSKQDDPLAEDEKAVDEYLEFLDRRYRRLHEDAPTEPQFAMSAWKWLKQEPLESTTDVHQQQQQEDALYVLGVAGLASKRLLQKHHIAPKALEQEHAAPVNSNGVSNVMDVPIIPAPALPVNVVSQAFVRLTQSRIALHKYQNDQFRSALAFCVRGPVRLCRSLWQMGGGRHNVIRTLAFSSTLMFLLVRPFLHFVANESLNMTRGA